MFVPKSSSLFAARSASMCVHFSSRSLPERFTPYGTLAPSYAPPMVYHPNYSCAWPEKHRFPMRKFSDLYNVVTENGPNQILKSIQELFCPQHLPDDTFTVVHSPEYYYGFVNKELPPEAMRRIGFPVPHSDGLIARTRLEVAGTLLTARLALEYGLACNLAGGTHHAFRDYGSGYTILNDLAVTAKALQRDESVGQIAIIDADVHQGDGTASIFANDDSVYTCSFHCEDNFPNIKQESDLDIGFPSGTGDAEFMPVFRAGVERVLSTCHPEIVLYDAGVDMYKGDGLGRMALSEAGLLERDIFLIRTCVEQGIPVCCVIGGGYDFNAQRLANRHAIIMRAAVHVWREKRMSEMPSWQ